MDPVFLLWVLTTKHNCLLRISFCWSADHTLVFADEQTLLDSVVSSLLAPVSLCVRCSWYPCALLSGGAPGILAGMMSVRNSPKTETVQKQAKTAFIIFTVPPLMFTTTRTVTKASYTLKDAEKFFQEAEKNLLYSTISDNANKLSPSTPTKTNSRFTISGIFTPHSSNTYLFHFTIQKRLSHTANQRSLQLVSPSDHLCTIRHVSKDAMLIVAEAYCDEVHINMLLCHKEEDEKKRREIEEEKKKVAEKVAEEKEKVAEEKKKVAEEKMKVAVLEERLKLLKESITSNFSKEVVQHILQMEAEPAEQAEPMEQAENMMEEAEDITGKAEPIMEEAENLTGKAENTQQQLSVTCFSATTVEIKNEAAFRNDFLKAISRLAVRFGKKTCEPSKEVKVTSPHSLFSGFVDAVIDDIVVHFADPDSNSDSDSDSEPDCSRVVFEFKRADSDPVPQGLFGSYCYLIQRYLRKILEGESVGCLVMCVGRPTLEVYKFVIKHRSEFYMIT